MSEEVTVKIHEDVVKKAENNVLQLLQDLSNDIVEVAKEIVPVRTGKLRDSLRILEYNEKEGFTRIGSDVAYGLYQELGSVKNAPQPHLRPAAEEVLHNNQSERSSD